MKTETFYSPQGREIVIVFDGENFMFYHGDLIRHQQQWVREQRDSGYEPSEEEAFVCEFYLIGKHDWNIPERNWEEHMRGKSWVTDEMIKFIKDNA
jgi:hypothetical protein